MVVSEGRMQVCRAVEIEIEIKAKTHVHVEVR